MQYSQYKGPVMPTPSKSIVPITVEAPGRAPIVVQDDVMAEDDNNDPEQTTSVFDKIEPGRDIFAGEVVKNIESKQPVPPIRPEEVPKEISSFFQTEIAGMSTEKQPEPVLLPDENSATTPSSSCYPFIFTISLDLDLDLLVNFVNISLS
ncbi:hypothetical protein JB92DRAFT_2888260 [Gautieria morchelliformis]|nr:hypothetical protein JB92DRAFT_2888260 [Gautieria morchelliformis]